jgi:hypothetical protein
MVSLEVRVIKIVHRPAKTRPATSEQEIVWSVFQKDLERNASVLVIATRAGVQTMEGLYHFSMQ